MKTKPAHLALFFLLATLGTSCRTFRSFGRDVQHIGNHIEHAAHH